MYSYILIFIYSFIYSGKKNPPQPINYDGKIYNYEKLQTYQTIAKLRNKCDIAKRCTNFLLLICSFANFLIY